MVLAACAVSGVAMLVWAAIGPVPQTLRVTVKGTESCDVSADLDFVGTQHATVEPGSTHVFRFWKMNGHEGSYHVRSMGRAGHVRETTEGYVERAPVSYAVTLACDTDDDRARWTQTGRF